MHHISKCTTTQFPFIWTLYVKDCLVAHTTNACHCLLTQHTQVYYIHLIKMLPYNMPCLPSTQHTQLYIMGWITITITDLNGLTKLCIYTHQTFLWPWLQSWFFTFTWFLLERKASHKHVQSPTSLKPHDLGSTLSVLSVNTATLHTMPVSWWRRTDACRGPCQPQWPLSLLLMYMLQANMSVDSLHAGELDTPFPRCCLG